MPSRSSQAISSSKGTSAGTSSGGCSAAACSLSSLSNSSSILLAASLACISALTFLICSRAAITSGWSIPYSGCKNSSSNSGTLYKHHYYYIDIMIIKISFYFNISEILPNISSWSNNFRSSNRWRRSDIK